MRKILIADDEPAIRFLIRATLEDQGYLLLEAADGLEAYELARSERPDLIVLDVMMPQMSGYELCSRLKADPAYRAIIVLMLTAKAQEADRKQAARAGVDYYLPKPFSPLDLTKIIRFLLAGMD
ncbi:MAG: response regulator [Firmicutes bacterium]|nr:response regulator [Bacillota bacterium]